MATRALDLDTNRLLMPLRKYRWKGDARGVARIWTLRKEWGEAVCRVLTHPAGWEVRLTIDDFVLGRETFQMEAAVVSHAADWHTRFIEHGWQA